jgi:phenylpyruvate tautomerase PptA (4-oxalocrotonate tautomerase family)
MPILDIEIVASDSTKNLPADLTQLLADEVAQVFGTSSGRVWIKMRVISPEHYAENDGKPEGVYPVFVTVLKSRVPEGSALENEIVGLTKLIANVLNRPEENIHIFYQPDGAGRVAFGGKLVS